MGNPHPSNPIKPGETRNPNGRPPKGYSITEWFREMMGKNPKIKDAIGKSILKKALEGDIAAQKLIWNYMDGLPIAKNEVHGNLTIADLIRKTDGDETDEETSE